MFVDFAGQSINIIDTATGDVSKAHLFLAFLGASNYGYAEATSAQDLPSWINTHIHAFKYFAGIPCS